MLSVLNFLMRNLKSFPLCGFSVFGLSFVFSSFLCVVKASVVVAAFFSLHSLGRISIVVNDMLFSQLIVVEVVLIS